MQLPLNISQKCHTEKALLSANIKLRSEMIWELLKMSVLHQKLAKKLSEKKFRDLFIVFSGTFTSTVS